MKTQAVIYGLRAKDADASQYFYVGSTKRSPKQRFHCHLSYARTGRNVNKHLERKMLKIGVDNIVLDVLATVPLSERAKCEYETIAKFRAQGMKLCNILLADAGYERATSFEKYKEFYVNLGRDKDFALRSLDQLAAGAGRAVNPKCQHLLELFWKSAVIAYKRIAWLHWDEYLGIMKIEKGSEIAETLRAKMIALPDPV